MSESKIKLWIERDAYEELFQAAVQARDKAEDLCVTLQAAMTDSIHAMDNPGSADARKILVETLIENTTGMIRDMALAMRKP